MYNQFLLQSGAGSMSTLILFLGMFVVMYFFFIRPQAKKQKEQNNFVNSLEKGMDVVTASGIVGKINKIEDDFVYLQIDPKTFLKIVKSAISKDMTANLKVSDTKEAQS